MCWCHHKMNNLFPEEQVPFPTYKSATKYDLDIPPIPRRTQLDLHYNYGNDFHFQILILVFFSSSFLAPTIAIIKSIDFIAIQIRICNDLIYGLSTRLRLFLLSTSFIMGNQGSVCDPPQNTNISTIPCRYKYSAAREWWSSEGGHWDGQHQCLPVFAYFRLGLTATLDANINAFSMSDAG